MSDEPKVTPTHAEYEAMSAPERAAFRAGFGAGVRCCTDLHGFTREDVSAARDAADSVLQEFGDPAWAHELNSLADRIEAMLRREEA